MARAAKPHERRGGKKKSKKPLTPELVETPPEGAIDHHIALEMHFEEYEMSRAPGS